MPLLVHRRWTRFAAAGALLLGTACGRATPAASQTLAARVAAAPDGVVRFSYPARDGVCGFEEGIGYRDPRGGQRQLTFYGSFTSRTDSREWESRCTPGPLVVELSVASHQVTAMRARVGQPPSGATGTLTDLGGVAPEDAARYLLTLAETIPAGRGSRSENTLLADGVDLSADLLRIARTPTLPERTREQAVLWMALVGERPAVRQLQQLTEDTSVDAGVRGQAIFALGQTQEAEDATFLRALYRRLQDENLKEKAIFSLSQVQGQGSEQWLLALAANASESAKMREKAIFWAAESGVTLAQLDSLYGRLDTRALKEQVILAYSRSRDPQAAQRLLRLARGDADPELRGRAIFWLGQAAGREVTRELSGLATDANQNREVQEQAVFALSQRRDEGIPALLEIARTHRDPEVRKKAMFWLAQSRDPRALDLFEEILKP